ncbi:NifU family protein [Oscillospiraceae bacterium LTW-04]|nr:NifU family protein [Oscillospiraceae bacterium MB24-C1]
MMLKTNPILDKVINDTVRPQLLSHSGDIEVLSVANGILRFRLLGQCAGCPSAGLTTEKLVAQAVKNALPEITEVVLVQGVSDSLIAQARKILNKSDL